MPRNSNANKKGNSPSSKNIQLPAIPKQTVGAVAGAAAGSIAGPIGAVVGGVVGAVAGKAAEKGQPIASVPSARSMVKRSRAISKTPRKRGSTTKKSKTKARKAPARSRGKTKKTASRRSTMAKSRLGSRIRGPSKSPRSARKRSSGRRKRR